ncbi:MAG TPA: hypothetical protein VLW83_00170, partial [Candidatus Acidoferrales bacterium]|nr:hypothetical protein [Candidatus Acidoferrales bacterium]
MTRHFVDLGRIRDCPLAERVCSDSGITISLTRKKFAPEKTSFAFLASTQPSNWGTGANTKEKQRCHIVVLRKSPRW